MGIPNSEIKFLRVGLLIEWAESTTHPRLDQQGPKREHQLLAPAAPAALLAASRFAGLFVVSVFLQLAEHSALLHFLIEALQGAVNRFVRLNDNVDQLVHPPSSLIYPICRANHL